MWVGGWRGFSRSRSLETPECQAVRETPIARTCSTAFSVCALDSASSWPSLASSCCRVLQQGKESVGVY